MKKLLFIFEAQNANCVFFSSYLQKNAHIIGVLQLHFPFSSAYVWAYYLL
jgi:hypothetical protein